VTFSFVIWLFVTVFLLGFWGWTTLILVKQKKAWKFYAQKTKLRYVPNRFNESPEMSGSIDGYSVSAFTSEQSEYDERSEKRRTCIEINLNSAIPCNAAIASGDMVSVVSKLDLPHETKPDLSGWDDSYIIRTDNATIMEGYLTPERYEKLIQIMKAKQVWVILIFMQGRGLLRFDTANPLIHPKDIDKFVSIGLEAAKIFELQAGEAHSLLLRKSDQGMKRSKINVDEQEIENSIGFELEE